MEKKNWIQDAVKHKGALRKEAKREHLIKGDEKLSMTDLNKLEKKGGKTAKRAVLAKTLRKFYGGGEPDEDYQILIFGEERPEPEEESEEPDYYDDDYASGGKIKEKVFIEYLNKSKGYKMDRKYFNSYQEAERWARNNFDKFNTDYIRYEYAEGGMMADGGEVSDINALIRKNKNKITKLLIEKYDFGAFDGGCVIVADAISKWIGGDVFVLIRKDGFADHAVVKKGYILFDLDGGKPLDKFIKNFNEQEMASTTMVRPIKKSDLKNAPRDAELSNKIKEILSAKKMAVGGEIEWGEDLGDGFSVGNDVYITDSKSMYQGKTGFVSGLIGKDLLVTISENGNERSVFVSKKGVEKLDAPEFAKGGKVKKDFKVGVNPPKKELDEFFEYVKSFYGHNGVRENDFPPKGASDEKIKGSINVYMTRVKYDGVKWGGGDSIDRERVKEIMITNYRDKMAYGGMTPGRYYQDNKGQEFRFVGESEGKLLFKDGEKVISKSEEDFEDMPQEKKLFKFFRVGGEMEMAEPEESQEYYASMQYAKGGETSKDKLIKELQKLQIQLNSSRLSKYKEGDTSEEEMARKRERDSKLARFNEILEILKENDKMAKGGLTKIEQKKISSLDETQKKNLSNEIDNEIGKVNDIDFYELSNGNKVKANSLMKKAYHDARKKAFAKFGIKYMAEGGRQDFKMLRGEKMAKGGTFDSKVNAIAKKLEGKPVPAPYRKEYGTRYDKEDAKEAASRIVGNMRKMYGE